MLDRIDMRIDVPAVALDELQRRTVGESSVDVRARVEAARSRMLARQRTQNSVLDTRATDTHCPIDTPGTELLRRAASSSLGLSARSYHRTLKVARSVADLAGVERIEAAHVAEALGYRRRLDEQGAGYGS